MSTWQRISLWQTSAAILLAGMALLAGPLAPDADASHITCGAVLGPGGSFILDSNIGPCPGPALTLVGPVALDMRGRTISCVDGGLGVSMEGRGAQIKNGTIDGCLTTVDIVGGQHRISRLLVFPRGPGAYEVFTVFGTGRNNFTDNTVFCDASAGSRGFAIYSSINTLSLNYVEDCETAYFVRGDRNSLSRNDTEFGTTGYELGGNSNTLTSNHADGHATAYLVHGTRNVLRSNRVGNESTGVGFHVLGNLTQLTSNSLETWGEGFVVESDQNKLISNTIGLEEDAGPAITVSGQSNLIQNNKTISSSAGPHLVDTNPNCDANRWIKNTGVANQPCVD